MTADLDGSRPQDQGRRHRRQGQPSAATRSLLERYQEAMRRELGRLLGELELEVAGLAGTTALAIDKPSDRAARWDLAIKLARELGTEVDPAADTPAVAAASSRPTRPRRRMVALGPG